MTMMKKLLLVVWCVKLADEKPFHPEFTAQYIFTSSKQVKNPSTKFSQTIKQIGKPKITEPFLRVPSFSAPEEFSSSKHESGYSMLSKTFTNSIGPTKDGHDDGSKFILDNRVLYHSLTNPLFKSKSLNLNDENDNPRVISDIYKFSSPFESKWLFSPKFSKLVDGKSPISEFQSIFHALKIDKLNDHQESAIESPPDSVFPSPSNLDLERYSKLGDESIDTLPSLENLGKDQFDEIIKDNTDILTDIGDNALFKSIEKSNFNDVVPKNGSYIGYNLQEVKTPQGEVQGIMQIFDKNGLAQKIHYNDKGIVSKTAVSNTTSSQKPNAKLIPTIPDKDVKNPLHNVVKTAVKQLKENGNIKKPNLAKNISKINSNAVSSNKLAIPEVKKISVKIEGHNYSNSSSPQHNHNSYPINEPKNPENILSDFLQQLNGVSEVSDNANVRTDVHNSFHETVSENSYSYT